ncbi:MAG: TrbC/VirB2 family protein [Pseudomonadota bacterium]
MKKILFSLLFLFLISLSSNSFAQTVGCSGNIIGSCIDQPRQSALNCNGSNGTSTVAGTATNGGCTWTIGTNVCSFAVAGTCAGITSAGICNAISGCSWVSVGNANQNAFVTTLCNALKIVTGNGGKAFAAFAIISCGIGFFTGKISWGLMIGITAGIAAMFGAPTIVAAISGGNALDCAAS